MGIMDKLGQGVEKVKTKTNDAIDVNSLKSKINDENRNIEKKKMEIGEHYWNLYKSGKKIDPDAKALFDSIDESTKQIEEYQKQIDDIKKE